MAAVAAKCMAVYVAETLHAVAAVHMSAEAAAAVLAAAEAMPMVGTFLGRGDGSLAPLFVLFPFFLWVTMGENS